MEGSAPILGIVVQLLISLIILRLTVKQNLSVLGFYPPIKRLVQFSIGFLVAGILCVIVQWIDSTLIDLNWKLKQDLSFLDIMNFFWLNFKSVLFEELIFRGALLYILIKRLGFTVGIVTSSISFGIYHWFSYGIIGDIVPMIIVFLITGLTGLIWAYAFVKTKSIAVPLGLHLGWNFTLNSVFSKGPWGQQILIPIEGAGYSPLVGIPSLLNFIIPNVVIPLIIYLIVKIIYKDDKQLIKDL